VEIKRSICQPLRNCQNIFTADNCFFFRFTEINDQISGYINFQTNRRSIALKIKKVQEIHLQFPIVI